MPQRGDDDGTVVLSSASSKTANGLAFLLSRREGTDVIGLTSSASAEFARGIGVYDHVITYDELDSLPAERAVYVDMDQDLAEPPGIGGRHPLPSAPGQNPRPRSSLLRREVSSPA